MEKIKIKQATKMGFIEMEVGGVFDANQPKSKTRRGRVQGAGHICPTITSQQMDVHRITKENEMYRIRKLSSRECFRLMGYTDEDYEKAESAVSSTQRYKQAGNAICENVLVAIFGQMIPGKEDVYKTIARNEDGSRKPYVID